jgi:integrase/recombinase XerD
MSKTDLLSITDSGALSARVLTAAEFQGLADVPPELEWFANIQNAKTRRAY